MIEFTIQFGGGTILHWWMPMTSLRGLASERLIIWAINKARSEEGRASLRNYVVEAIKENRYLSGQPESSMVINSLLVWVVAGLQDQQRPLDILEGKHVTILIELLRRDGGWERSRWRMTLTDQSVPPPEQNGIFRPATGIGSFRHP